MKVAPTKFSCLLSRRARVGALTALAACLVLGVSAGPAHASDLDFGSVRVGTSSQMQLSIQTSTGPINSATIEGDTAFFVDSFACSPQGGPFYSCTIQVSFAPTVDGLQTQTLNTDNAGSYSLSGTGTYGPGALADPLNFGDVRVGAQKTLQTTVTNNGDEDLTLSLSSTGDYSFSGCSSTVAPGGNCQLDVTFSPSAPGLHTENVALAPPNFWGTNDLMLDGDGVFVYQVTSAANSGPGTLRDAIVAANATSGPYTITFAIPGAGVHKIRVQGALPPLTTSTTIDGTSQPGYAGAPLIQLDNRSGHTIPGLDLAATMCVVRGLNITGFGTGIRIEPDTNTDTVAGNRIGLDTTGAVVGNGVGVLVLGNGNFIGGTNSLDRNLISGNTGQGISISGGFASSNVVMGNLIGTNAAGTAARPNGGFGVAISAGATANVVGEPTPGARNVISGNAFSGVGIGGAGTSDNSVVGNYLGTNITGSAAIPNGTHGVAIFNGASANHIGGGTGGRNVISGNTLAGVAIYDAATTGNSVTGNYIGTARDGVTALPNATLGIALTGSTTGNFIGSQNSGDRNLISGNSAGGVMISGPGATGNLVEGNWIGTDKNGAPLGNGGNGVTLYNGANGNTIGGLLSGEPNLIKNNTGAGVAVDNTGLPNTAGNSILRNSIDLNGGLGIALLGGANHGQPAPSILSVTTLAGTTTAKVALAASPSTQYRIQLFTSPACDASLAGEAATFRSGGTTTTNAAGTATVEIVIPALPPLQAVTASVTNTTTGDTSQLSICATS